jgi:hypothetical protein
MVIRARESQLVPTTDRARSRLAAFGSDS